MSYRVRGRYAARVEIVIDFDAGDEKPDMEQLRRDFVGDTPAKRIRELIEEEGGVSGIGSVRVEQTDADLFYTYEGV